MPTQEAFGARTTADMESVFATLKGKGDKVTVRFIKPPFYDGKHFVLGDDGKYHPENCPKIMTDEYCERCDKFYALMADRKKAKEAGDKKEEERIDKVAKEHKVKLTFYYPVINREAEKCQILKVPFLIRSKIDQEASLGIDVTKYDYIVCRTEKPGTDYYTLTRLDSAMSKPLTEKEQIEVKKGETILDMLKNKKESSQSIEVSNNTEAEASTEEPMNETVNPEDIPF